MQGVAAQVFRLDLGQIVPAQVADRQLPENVIDDRRCHLDMRIALNHAVRLEAREQKGVDIFFQRHTVLQAERNGDGKAIGHAAESGSLFVHVQENLTQRAVLIFSGAKIDFVIADAGFLGVAGPAIGQPATLADESVDQFLRGLNHLGLRRRLRFGLGRFDRVGNGIERLAQL